MPRVDHPTRLAGTCLIIGVVAFWHPLLVAQSDSTINSPASDSPSDIDLPKDDSAAAKLLHFASPQKIHGRFVVQFKSTEELEADADKLRAFTEDRWPTSLENAT